MGRERSVSAYDFAVVQAGLGDNQAALTSLEAAYANRAGGVRWLKIEPMFAALRGEPRFEALVRKVGLPD
jgi:serine/threonine-protein kinase